MEAVVAAAPYLSAGFSVASGLMSIQQSREQASAMRFQGEMSLLQAQERSINYKREELNARKQANSIMERVQRANAAVVARAAAQNIMPFEGSPLDLQKFNDTKGGDEWATAKDNAEAMGMSGKRALQMGMMQRDQYMSAADSTESAGLMRGLFSIGSGVVGFAKLGSAPAGANSISSIDRVNSFDDGSMARAMGLRFR